jgi:hypothetical protein
MAPDAERTISDNVSNDSKKHSQIEETIVGEIPLTFADWQGHDEPSNDEGADQFHCIGFARSEIG